MASHNRWTKSWPPNWKTNARPKLSLFERRIAAVFLSGRSNTILSRPLSLSGPSGHPLPQPSVHPHH